MNTDIKTIVIAGGSGYLGLVLQKHLKNYRFVILSRKWHPDRGNVHYVTWDAQNHGAWVEALEGSAVLINLTGKSVNCRYNRHNKTEILSSRINATAALGNAIQKLRQPPSIWINASSATIYRHSEDRPMDEYSGEIGSDFSMDVCKAWEAEFNRFSLLHTRKIILRIGIVVGNEGDVLKKLQKITRLGLGGAIGNGRQYMNWIQDIDFARIVKWCIDNPKAEGIYNATSPKPMRNRDFMKKLRNAMHVSVGLPTPEWLLKIGMWLIRSEAELLLKSRWVIPTRLLKEGFEFKHKEPQLTPDLIEQQA